VNAEIRRRIADCKRRIQKRLEATNLGDSCPVISASNIQYELAERTKGIAAGGIGIIQPLVKRLELDQAINRQLNLLKIYLPYSESDHVLNIAYNLLAGGTCLEHLELRRNNEAYLDALGSTTQDAFLRYQPGNCLRRSRPSVAHPRLAIDGRAEANAAAFVGEAGESLGPPLIFTENHPWIWRMDQKES
jgi:hypothetical protein